MIALRPLFDLDVRVPRETDFTKEEMRSWALKVLAAMAGLSRSERDRVTEPEDR